MPCARPVTPARPHHRATRRRRRDPCAASTRVTGLGALNRFFVLYGLFLAILNVLPVSLDCQQSMQSWLGRRIGVVGLEVENFLNLMWCIALLGFGLMTAGVAALPKLTQYTSPSPGYPQKINQLAMQILAVCHLIVLAWMLVASLTMTVHVDGTVADLSSLMAIAIAFLPLLLYCLWIHREPTTGDWIVMV